MSPLPPQSPGLCTRHLWEHGVLRGIRRGQAKSIRVKQTLVTLVFLRVKKPTVVLPQLRVQLPEAAITSIPLYRPNLRHTGNVTGADRKTGKTTPSPRTATPSDGFLRLSPPQKRRNAQAIVLSSLHNPSSAHLSCFSQSPKSKKWARQGRLQTPGAANCQSGEKLHMQPWQPPLGAPR